MRAALDRERAENHRSAELRFKAEEDGRHRAVLESQIAAQARRENELRFNLREAEAERERLRTLLAGTVWFDAKA